MQWANVLRGLTIGVCSFFLSVSALAEELSPSTSADKTPAELPTTNVTDSSSRYYAIFGSYQAADKSVASSHSFAVFFRTDGAKASAARVKEHCTISWLPVSNQVGLSRPTEPGVNRSLAETIAIAEKQHSALTFDGPFETDAELFRRAVAQVERLKSGEVRYKCMDRYTRATAKNCMHAISDIVEENGRLTTFTQRGREGTQLVIQHFHSHLLQPGVVAAGVAEPLYAAVNLSRFRVAPAEQGLDNAVADKAR